MKEAKTLLLVLFTLALSVATAQSDREKAHQKLLKAVELMDEGKLDESIELLEQGQKLDPQNGDFPYETGFAYYQKGEYKKALKYIESALKLEGVTDQYYEMQGNCYDMLGKREKALEAYQSGLKVFPSSGRLHLEMGVMYVLSKEYETSLSYFEKGILVDPAFPSNYYWAAKLYCNSTEEMWGMIYGEIFMNLERNSKRTAEISKLLYDTYTSEITFDGNQIAVSFSQQATITIDQLKDTSGFRLPFGLGVYEPLLSLSIVGQKEINLTSLNQIRSQFVRLYFDQEKDKEYPNVLFAYQKKLLDLGYMDAYNHWLLMKGDEAAFSTWQEQHEEDWDSFVEWYLKNPIEITTKNRFHTSDY